MLLIAGEVEYALNEVLEKHGRVPLQQQVSQAELPKAARESGRGDSLLTARLQSHQEFCCHTEKHRTLNTSGQAAQSKSMMLLALFVQAQHFISKLRAVYMPSLSGSIVTIYYF